MESHSRLFKIKINTVINSEHENQFPEFLLKLRKAAGFSRQRVSKETGISQSRITYLESGDFVNLPNELPLLCDYFCVPRSLMMSKAKDYVYKKHLKRPKFPIPKGKSEDPEAM